MFYRVVKDGGRGTGVNPHGHDYPFVAPSPDVRNIFSDLYVSHQTPGLQPPYRLAWAYGFRDFLVDPAPAPDRFDAGLWLRAEDLRLSLNEKVGLWPDASVGGRPAQQSDLAHAPTYMPDGFAGRPAVSFSKAAEQCVTLGDQYLFSESDGLTICAVLQPNASGPSADYEYVFSFGPVALDGYGFVISRVAAYAGAAINAAGNSAHVSFAPLTNIPHICTFRIRFDSFMELRIDGARVLSGPIDLTRLTADEINAAATRQPNAGPVTIGGQSKTTNQTGRFFDGQIFELSWHGRYLADADLVALERDYYARKYVLPYPLNPAPAPEEPPAPPTPDGDALYAAAHAADLVVLDAQDAVVFDSTAASYRGAQFGERLYVHEWRTDTAVCRAVQHRGWDDAAETAVPTLNLAPAGGVLDARVVELMPRRVSSVLVAGLQLSPRLSLQAGYNVTLELAGDNSLDGGRYGQQIVISAEPGSGIGRFPGCMDPDPPLRRINSVRPNDLGDMLWEAADCYSLRPPVDYSDGVRVRPNLLRMGNDCGPCCDCEDFVNTYRGLQNVWERYRSVGVRAERTRNLLKANIARWEASRACRNERLIRVVALPFARQLIEVAVSVCNNTANCLYDLEVRITFVVNGVAHPEDYSVELIPCTGFISRPDGTVIPYSPSGQHPTYRAVFDVLPSSATGRVRFRVGIVPGPSDGMSFTIAAEARKDGAIWPDGLTPATTETTVAIKNC